MSLQQEIQRFQRIGETVIAKAKEAQERVVKQSLAYPDSVRSSMKPGTVGKSQVLMSRASSSQQEAQEIDVMANVIAQRDKQINQIHGIFENIHGIAKDINVDVYAQGEKVQTLEKNVDEAAKNVKDGNSELVQAKKHQKGRNKCVLITLIVVVIILIIVCISLFSS